jgi:hypothetical protein
VHAAQWQPDVADPRAAVFHGEGQGAVVGPHVDGAVVGAGGGAVGDGVVGLGQLRGVVIVDADDLGTGHAGEVLVEGGHDGLGPAEVVEVVHLDVGEDRAVQRQLEERAVALVGLDHEEVASGPVGARADVVHVPAHEEARLHPGFGEDHGEHRRGGGLAVCAGHGDGARTGADRGQHAGPAQHGDAEPARLVELDIGRRDGGRRGDSVDAVHDLALVADGDHDAGRPQPLQHRDLAQVRTRHGVTHLRQHKGDGAHPRSAHADDVVAAGCAEVDRHRRQPVPAELGADASRRRSRRNRG